MVTDKIPAANSKGEPLLDAKGRTMYIPVYADDLVVTRRTTVNKVVLPDVAAIIIWLANRDKDELGKPRWRRQDELPARPGDGDDLKTPEQVGQAMMKVSAAIMEVV